MRKPDFLGIGATKAGTSWLYSNLRKHPDIWLPPVKELHYFDRATTYRSPNYLAKPKLTGRAFGNDRASRKFRRVATRSFGQSVISGQWDELPWKARYFGGTISDDWYQSLFRDRAERCVGEITPAYSILDDQDVQSVSKFLPDTRIIFILRNPIDRVWSGIRYRRDRLGQLDVEGLKAAVDSVPSQARTNYIETLRRWRRHFPSDRMGVFFYDDLKSRPTAFLSDVFSFLGVPPQKVSDTETQVNVSRKSDIPEELSGYLASKYLDLLEALHADLAAPQTADWLNRAKKLQVG